MISQVNSGITPKDGQKGMCTTATLWPAANSACNRPRHVTAPEPSSVRSIHSSGFSPAAAAVAPSVGWAVPALSTAVLVGTAHPTPGDDESAGVAGKGIVTVCTAGGCSNAPGTRDSRFHKSAAPPAPTARALVKLTAQGECCELARESRT